MNNILELFDKILKKAVELNVSDVHVCSGSPWKYRLHGQITALNAAPPGMEDCEEIVRHIVESSNVLQGDDPDSALRNLKDLDCSYMIRGVSRFRVNICRQRGSFSVVLRVVPFTVPTIDTLGLPPVIRDISLEKRGLVLVTGITGSGKSTTLAAMINIINNEKPCKIVTIEDPIEYLHHEIRASIIQREVGFDTDSFNVALRAALRQDPDIILVGEMRDHATIETALRAAETGHLVMSTLHTTDAPRSVHRIISSFDLSQQQAIRARLADSLKAVISQRLLCRKDGKGRAAGVEIMRNTLTIKECIENPEKTGSIRDYMSAGRDQYGMQTFDQHLMELYRDGVIDLETAKSAATSSSDFERNVIFT